MSRLCSQPINFFLVFQIANSKNRVYLNAGSLMMNIADPTFDEGVEALGKKKR